MNAPNKHIAVVQVVPGRDPQDLFRELVDHWRPMRRMAGVIAESHGLAERRCTAGYLRSIGSEARFSIFADQGAGSTVCNLDGDGAIAAGDVVQRDIAAGCDVVMLSKFGKLEAFGKGLRHAFDAAFAARVPLLTTVSPSVMEAWTGFASTEFITLPAAIAAIDQWIDALI